MIAPQVEESSTYELLLHKVINYKDLLVLD